MWAFFPVTVNNMASNAHFVERISLRFYQEGNNKWSGEQFYQDWTHLPLSNSTKDIFLLWHGKSLLKWWQFPFVHEMPSGNDWLALEVKKSWLAWNVIDKV